MTMAIDFISIHSLRMEGDPERHLSKIRKIAFQSTPSAWRETTLGYVEGIQDTISIHSLRMEGDVLLLTQ